MDYERDSVHVQYDQDVHARYINFSTGLRVRGDRCLDIYRRPQKKGMLRSCLPTEIFIERVRNDHGTSRVIAAGGANYRSDGANYDQGRKRAQASPRRAKSLHLKKFGRIRPRFKFGRSDSLFFGPMKNRLA